MAQNKQALKSRIRSTTATIKITKAMQLIANAKLLKIRNTMEQNREYSEVLLETLHQILANNRDLDNPFLKGKSSDRVLTIVFSSDLGLCGGYNSNMFRYALEASKLEDPIMVIGSKGRGWFSNRGYVVINDYIDSDNLDYGESSKLMDKAIDMYLKNEIGRIQVIYTEFINAITFKPAKKLLLPVEKNIKEEKQKVLQETLFVPGVDEICEELIPMTLKSVLYSLWLQTKTSEQASRRVAMESATDNGEELKEQLTLQYNQARQAAITQEITEIVAGAGAL
ncbi:ATP synthase F1 subunit gamma [Alloiococcus sp. CFN-8]|uniref:ATP synthase F1 subunit gamma n=1 Tax=Alloiococcus sp. CFN-8 TaxID=3416081 RepID=UPI003CF3D6C2